MLEKIKVANGINYSSVLPTIDKTIRILVKDGSIELQATSLDQWYVGREQTSWPDMDVIVEGPKLASAYQLLGEDIVGSLDPMGVQLTLKSPKGRMNLQIIEGEFPELKRPEAMIADMDAITDMGWACSSDELRPALTGIYFGKDAVATDANRMAVRHDVEGPGVIIPPHVMKFKGRLSVAEDKRSVYVIGEDWYYGSLLIDAKYVPYDSVLRKTPGVPLKLPASVVKILLDKTVIEAGSVKLSGGTVSAINPAKDINIVVNVDIETDHSIWFNPKWLAEVIQWIGLDVIEFSLSEDGPSHRAMQWTDGKRTAMIMPMAGME